MMARMQREPLRSGNRYVVRFFWRGAVYEQPVFNMAQMAAVVNQDLRENIRIVSIERLPRVSSRSRARAAQDIGDAYVDAYEERGGSFPY